MRTDFGNPDFGGTSAAAPRSSKTNVLAIISLVAGVISIPIFCCWPVSMPTALVAIVLGVVAINQIKKTGEQGRAFAIAGIATAVLAILLFVVLVVIGGAVDQNAMQNWINKQQGIEQPGADEGMGLEEDAESDLGAPGDATPADGEAMEGDTEAAPEPAEQ